MIDPELRADVEAWIAGDPHEADRAELSDLLTLGAKDALRERFAGPLTFGTAGLRGPLRAGPNGMNLAVVRRTTAGIARWVRSLGGSTVVVGYDARHRSVEFALDTAATLAGAGLTVRLADRAWPTPCTAFAVAWCGAHAAVQITASHNPARDNGYKVYDATGAQIIPPDDTRIAAEIAAQPSASTIPTLSVEPELGDDLFDAYCAMALEATPPNGDGSGVRIVYTPLHGVGGALALRLLRAAGFAAVHPVDVEMTPDPDFPGLPFPNPEEDGVLDAADAVAVREALAERDIVVANDPDADRIAVAVTSPVHGRRRLSGDELGTLLGEARLSSTHGRRIVARSRVSSSALSVAAAAHGAECIVTPTGFKWLVRAADGRGAPLVFAYEEALGYAVTNRVRDKDGMTALLLVARLAATEHLLERLARVAARDGLFVTSQWAPRFEGSGGHDEMRNALARLDAGEADPIEVAFPEGTAKVRQSGTEAKLKCYFEVVLTFDEPSAFAYETARERGLVACERMRVALAERLGLAS